MKDLKIFINLTRLNRPIGYLLLFWPCSWGLAYAYSVNQNINIFLGYTFLFLLGSILMRSAGCIVNDIVDKDYDKKVDRTKKRPLAVGIITIKQSLAYVLILCLVAFFILIQFNLLTIILGMSSMLLAFAYPFMKRITYWPQLFLGVTFNWGIIMAWAAIHNNITVEISILYVSAIFWTLGYDTIYGAQDMSDDEIIGLKSTSIKFKNNLWLFVSVSYLVSIILIIYLFNNYYGNNLFSLFSILFFFSLFYQLFNLRTERSNNLLKLFKLNNYAGMFLFLGIFSISL